MYSRLARLNEGTGTTSVLDKSCLLARCLLSGAQSAAALRRTKVIESAVALVQVSPLSAAALLQLAARGERRLSAATVGFLGVG